MRIDSPGATGHVMNRGDQREAFFRDDLDREKFTVILGEARGLESGQFSP